MIPPKRSAGVDAEQERPEPSHGVRLSVASRGDALTPYLLSALGRRFGPVPVVDAELSRLQRYQVAATTFRPSRSRWAERFYKSAYGSRLRSRNALEQLGLLPERPDVVLQIHALFELPSVPTVLYVDCTHRQSADNWPAWNPLRGRALEEWYRKERAGYHAARHIFAFSKTTRDSLVEDYGVPSARVTVTGAGVNLDRMPDPVAPGGRSTEPTILFIGNDFVRKGGLILLDAFARVRETIPGARLQLVGTDPGITPPPGVEVLGRIRDRQRVTELYREATVFTVPSYFDPFPLVALEAMAFGLPVIATRQEGVPEMIEDRRTGLLVDAGDAGGLADALLALLAAPDLRSRLGGAARIEVGERFMWDSVVERMRPVLEGMATAHGAR
jgi:glycosyltransferase involved in cell wall biosynthesis